MTHPKGLLIERVKRLGLGKPDFQTKSTGPAHEPTFLCDVLIGGEVFGTGQGSNKREAERHAAEEALARLDAAGEDEQEAEQEVEPEVEQEIEQGGSSKRAAKHQAADNATSGDEDAGEGTEASTAAADELPFEGPWPIFEQVLAVSLQMAEKRTDKKLKGKRAIQTVRDLALELYKDVLEDLGEVVEVDEES